GGRHRPRPDCRTASRGTPAPVGPRIGRARGQAAGKPSEAGDEMSMNPAGADGPTGHATADGWPTDDDILALAKNENIPLYAEAYAIAHQYNRISQALAAQLGKEDLSWCGFAKWSSKAIGSELRLNEHSP